MVGPGVGCSKTFNIRTESKNKWKNKKSGSVFKKKSSRLHTGGMSSAFILPETPKDILWEYPRYLPQHLRGICCTKMSKMITPIVWSLLLITIVPMRVHASHEFSSFFGTTLIDSTPRIIILLAIGLASSSWASLDVTSPLGVPKSSRFQQLAPSSFRH